MKKTYRRIKKIKNMKSNKSKSNNSKKVVLHYFNIFCYLTIILLVILVLMQARKIYANENANIVVVKNNDGEYKSSSISKSNKKNKTNDSFPMNDDMMKIKTMIDKKTEEDIKDINHPKNDFEKLLVDIEDIVTSLKDNDKINRIFIAGGKDNVEYYCNSQNLSTNFPILYNYSNCLKEKESENNPSDEKTKINTCIENFADNRMIYPDNPDEINLDYKTRKYMKSYFTDITTTLFSSDKYDRIKLLDLVFKIDDVFNKAYYGDEYDKNTSGIYLKGGFLLRMKVHTWIGDLYDEISTKFLHYFKSNFKISDFDFEIDSPIDDKIKIHNITYVVFERLLVYLHKHKDYYFKFYKLEKKHQNNILMHLRLNLTKELTTRLNDPDKYDIDTQLKDWDITWIDLWHKESFSVFHNLGINSMNFPNSENSNDKFLICKFKEFCTFYEITDIPGLSLNGYRDNKLEHFFAVNVPLIKFGEDEIIQFELNRMKVSFSVKLKNKIYPNIEKFLYLDGELLDYSTSLSNVINKDLSKLMKETMRIGYNSTIMTHLNMKGLFVDLVYLIIYDYKFTPWNDTKYEKRVQRLVILYILNMLDENNNYGTFTERISTIEKTNNILKTRFINCIKITEIQNNHNNFDNNNFDINTYFLRHFNFFHNKQQNKDDDMYVAYIETIISSINIVLYLIKTNWNISRKGLITNNESNFSSFDISNIELYDVINQINFDLN